MYGPGSKVTELTAPTVCFHDSVQSFGVDCDGYFQRKADHKGIVPFTSIYIDDSRVQASASADVFVKCVLLKFRGKIRQPYYIVFQVV